MNKTTAIIKDNLSIHPEFEYYFGNIEIAVFNVINNPDVSIEVCKSLFEGIAKTILKKIDNTYIDRDIDSMDLAQLFRKFLDKLSSYCNVEVDFITRCCSLVHMLGEIRNRRGDVSHGKKSPKDEFSDSQFSEMILTITDELLYYILNLYYSIDFSYILRVQYQDHQEFNEYLDETNPMNSISYSQALYDQDYDAYVEELSNYRYLLDNP